MGQLLQAVDTREKYYYSRKAGTRKSQKTTIIRIYSDLSPITPTTSLQGVKFEKKVQTVVNHTLEAPIMQN